MAKTERAIFVIEIIDPESGQIIVGDAEELDAIAANMEDELQEYGYYTRVTPKIFWRK